LDTSRLQAIINSFSEFTNRCSIFQKTYIPESLRRFKTSICKIQKWICYHGLTRFVIIQYYILKPIIGTVEGPTSCISGPLQSTRPHILYEYAPVRIHLRSIRRSGVYYYKYKKAGSYLRWLGDTARIRGSVAGKNNHLVPLQKKKWNKLRIHYSKRRTLVRSITLLLYYKPIIVTPYSNLHATPCDLRKPNIEFWNVII